MKSTLTKGGGPPFLCLLLRSTQRWSSSDMACGRRNSSGTISKGMDADVSHRRPMTRKTLDRSFNRNTGQGLLISALDVQGCFRYSFRRNGASGTSPASSPPQWSTVPAEAWVANFRLHSLARWRGKRQRAFCFGGSVALCLHGFGSAGRYQTEPATAGRGNAIYK